MKLFLTYCSSLYYIEISYNQQNTLLNEKYPKHLGVSLAND